eukprot:2619158-Heterocapsa_arctica.AAC.1
MLRSFPIVARISSSRCSSQISSRSSAKMLRSEPEAVWTKTMGSTFSRVHPVLAMVSARCSWNSRGASRRP